ncbi:MAG: sulfotransferase [Sulfuricella sp.]|nr:sulfotransferase [Sulfuricella sp.]
MDTKPSTRYHPLPVKLFNLAARARNALGLARIDLSEQALLAEARKQTGLERFGDEGFLPALRVLLDAVESEASLNPFGRYIARARTLGSLRNRLWANACFEAHPEIRQRKIVAPVVIVGPHRSGTTRLQRMLAADARWRYLKTWEGLNPAPRMGWPEAGRAARHEEARKTLEMRHRMYPGASMVHPMDADWPEEEMLLLNHSFCSFSALGLYNIPSYYRWFLDADKTGAYRDMADQLRLISWSSGDPEDQRWILKNPQHMLDLGTLLKTFPDARVVFTHRDPLKTVGSVMSLMWRFAVQHTDMPCRGQIREVWLDFCEQAARRCIEARETIPAAQQLDVHYEDMNRDWRAAMRRIYDFAGMEFTAGAEDAMDAWLADSEREARHAGHRYALEEFGTTRDEVEARMKFYRERYAIPYEGKKA